MIPEPNFARTPLMVGVELGRGNGGPYKTLFQFKNALPADIVSISKPSTEQVPGDGIIHIISGKGIGGESFLALPAAGQRHLAGLIARASLVQCHVMFRHHASFIRKHCLKNNIPYWVIPHGCLDPYVFSYRRWRKLAWMHLVGKRVLRDAKAVIFATQREQRKAQKWMSRPNGHVLHWPVVLPATSRNEDDRAALRQRLGLRTQTRVLLHLGRLHPSKRPVEAATLFTRSLGPDCHLLFVGGDETGVSDALRTAIEQSPHQNAGWIGSAYGEEKEAIMRGCDGYWSYSIKENFNHTAAESLAAGLPLILSPGNDLGEELREAGVGWMLASDREDTVRDSLRAWAVLSESQLASLGHRGRDWASRHLSQASFDRAVQRLAAGS